MGYILSERFLANTIVWKVVNLYVDGDIVETSEIEKKKYMIIDLNKIA
jgi:hypothetical protein